MVGLRGSTVWDRLAPYFQPARKKPVLSKQPQLVYGTLSREGLGDEIVLLLQGHADSQYLELQTHGGPGIVQWCLDLAKDIGCEIITWTEWHEDEILNLLAQAGTSRIAARLLDQLDGRFWKKAQEIERDRDREEVLKLWSYRILGSRLVEPWKITLAGAPNAGKSSLLNALVGYERAIISDIPGTTRDQVKAMAAWRGWQFQFIDTAGLRETEDALEQEGMEKTLASCQSSDLIVWLNDLSQPMKAVPAGIRADLTVGTKADLIPEIKTEAGHSAGNLLAISSHTHQGIPEFLDAIYHKLIPQEPPPGQPLPVTPAQTAELARLYSLLV